MRFAALLFLMLMPVAAMAEPTPSGVDTSKPVEVNADELEVLQDQNKAIFTGNVIAVQGDMRMKADKMTVFYRKKEAEGAPKTGEPTDNTISRLEVDGNVLLSTPEETASGVKGIYDVDAKEVRLLGNVVLTREQNVLKGQKLVYDLASGRSTLDGGSARKTSTGRVRGLFVPQEVKSKEGTQ